MAKNSSSSKGNKPEIARAEWDFRDVPSEEVMECCSYEYARSSPAVREAYEQALVETPVEKRSRGYLPLSSGYGLSLECPEFPSKPWLEIDRKTRRKRVVRWCTDSQVAFSPVLPVSGLKVAIDCKTRQERIISAPSPLLPPPGFNKDTGEEIGLFKICWGCPETRIVEDFARWLKANYAQKHEAITNRDAIQRSRLGSTASKMLKALAAWRLLRIMSWKEADKLTSSQGGLFAERSGWSRAKKQAEQFLFGESDGVQNISA